MSYFDLNTEYLRMVILWYAHTTSAPDLKLPSS